MIYYIFIYYHLLHFPLPFTTIYFSFITSFITICNLGIFVTNYSIITNGVFIWFHWSVISFVIFKFGKVVGIVVMLWMMAVVSRWQICAHTNLALFSHKFRNNFSQGTVANNQKIQNIQRRWRATVTPRSTSNFWLEGLFNV